ncbi:MAG TPA: hypothetical protein VEK82_10565 [Stellaceae bacterium]|nr:hypothetical protein [Stellaceae bacterium]
MFLREWRAAPSLMATGMALYERFIYHADGSFLTGSLADHAVPTAGTVPELTVLHREAASPLTPFRAKGVAEGNSMSTPVCIAYGVADLESPPTAPRVPAFLNMAGRRLAAGEARTEA